MSSLAATTSSSSSSSSSSSDPFQEELGKIKFSLDAISGEKTVAEIGGITISNATAQSIVCVFEAAKGGFLLQVTAKKGTFKTELFTNKVQILTIHEKTEQGTLLHLHHPLNTMAIGSIYFAYSPAVKDPAFTKIDAPFRKLNEQLQKGNKEEKS